MDNQKAKTLICFIQLGSPKGPEITHVRRFLKDFLGDKRVVDTQPILFKIVLYLFILPFRPRHSSKLYGRIWDGKSFPLIEITKKFAYCMQQNFLEANSLHQDVMFDSDYCFILSKPQLSEVLKKNFTKILFVPLFPQYSESTTASTIDYISQGLNEKVVIPNFEVLNSFHKSKAFIKNSARNIIKRFEELKEQDVVINSLLISFHGIPKRRVIYKDDPYYLHCMETYYLIKQYLPLELQGLIVFSFQSRFGSEEWLTPYTEDIVEQEINEGRDKILVYCPSFVADCLESLDEIGHELAHFAKKREGQVYCVPCLNDDALWCKDFSEYLISYCLSDYKKLNELELKMNKEDYMSIEKPVMKSPPLSSEAKSTLKIVFLTLFLDLVGFSIIFPLFPGLAKYYMEMDSQNFFLKGIFDGIHFLLGKSEAIGIDNIVLFGGALGALYSLLQFIAAPLWGGLSDRIGRRPVLLVSVFGLALSYLLWFFSGSFTILILARLIGGIMGGNISTATAVVADITVKENRSKGMAFIGIAFALGFIIGPAMGGLLSFINLAEIYPSLEAYGVNPYSLPALAAFILSAFNFIYIYKKLKESLPASKRQGLVNQRSANIFKLFKPLPHKGINATILGHFFFLAAFSGMEFTLTFLALERLNFSAMDNAYMFIFIGFVLAFVQGGVVRRKAHIVGEKKMSLMGLFILIPGMLLIGFAQSVFTLYAGLFFLAVGSSMIIPCLTSLVSLYTPANEQGRSIGIFRSLGALARVVGPIVASLIYWRLGSQSPYIYGAVFLFLPILLISLLPPVDKDITL